MSSQYTFIVNPIAGRGAGLLAIPELDSMAKNAGFTYQIIITEKPGHATFIAQEEANKGADIIIAVGGDGVANEVLNGVMRTILAGEGNPTMGVIGVGRGNDFAYGVGVSAGLKAGFEILTQGTRQSVDVGKVSGGMYPEGRYFGNGVGIGFDAVVGFEAAKIKYLHGFPNYVVAALKTMFLYFRAPLVRIRLDNETIDLPALMVSIMNGRRMGGGFMMAPNSFTNDGLFDLCIVEQVSRMGILGLIPQFMKGTQASHVKVKMRQSKSILVTANKGSLPAHADGETLCTEGQSLNIEMLPGALEIIKSSESVG